MKTYTQAQVNRGRLSAKLTRARSATGHGILYGLGHGGYDPNARLPSDGQGLCDCSGFALAWVPGISRDQHDKHKPWSADIPWDNTDAVVADAKGKQELFVLLAEPIPGCAMVYDRTMSGGESCGHCAIVTAVQRDLNGKVTKIIGIDCHGGVRGHTICAIEEHDLSYFLAKHALYVCLREDLA